MNEEIKPCPFCGSEGDYDDFIEVVICVNPKCNSYGPDGENESDSIQKWNQRLHEKEKTNEN